MLYKIVIADDEKNIREGLANFFDWKAVGFQVVQRFADGKDVIDYIENNHVDVVLSDIRMTNVSGLDLAKYIYEKESYIKVVLISGYKEFEYAKQAVNYNVFHYLLKPTQFDEIQQVFLDIKKQLDMEQKEKVLKSREQEQRDEILPLLREQFFSDLSIGALRNKEYIRKRLSLTGLEINPDTSICCSTNLVIKQYSNYINTSWEYGKDGLYSAIKNFILLEKNGLYFSPIYRLGGIIPVVIVAKDEMSIDIFKETVRAFFEEIIEGVNAILGISIVFRDESYYESLYELVNNYVSNPVTHEVNADSSKDTGNSEEQYKLFVSYINDKNMDSASYILDNIIKGFSSEDITVVQSSIYELFMLVKEKLVILGTKLDDKLWDKVALEDLKAFKNPNEIKLRSHKILNEIIEHVSDTRTIQEGNVLIKAKDFINKNYFMDLSLEDVSNEVFLSPIYFSRLFKQQSGENFSDYLIKVRIEKAMELLENTDYKIYDICTLVGYKTIKYFYKLFKHYTGVTPTEYRMKVLGKSGEEND